MESLRRAGEVFNIGKDKLMGVHDVDKAKLLEISQRRKIDLENAVNGAKSFRNMAIAMTAAGGAGLFLFEDRFVLAPSIVNWTMAIGSELRVGLEEFRFNYVKRKVDEVFK